MQNNNNKRPVSRRKARLELKYRGTLRCEACGRHTEVDMEFYKSQMELKEKLEAKGHEHMFFCRRERCIMCRPEGLVPQRKQHTNKREDNHRSS